MRPSKPPTSAVAVRKWAEESFPDDFATLINPDDLLVVPFEIPGTSGTFQGIAITSFEPYDKSDEYLWPGTGEITVLAFVRGAALQACVIRNEIIVYLYPLWKWLKEYGPTYMDIFPSCTIGDHRLPSPTELALEMEAVVSYYLAAIGVQQALDCDEKQFRVNFERACHRQRQKLERTNAQAVDINESSVTALIRAQACTLSTASDEEKKIVRWVRELPKSSEASQQIGTRDAVEDEDTDVTKHVVSPEHEDDNDMSSSEDGVHIEEDIDICSSEDDFDLISLEDDFVHLKLLSVTQPQLSSSPGPIDDKKCEVHEAKMAALQSQLAELGSEVNKAKGAVERVADLEKDITAYKQEKTVMQEMIKTLKATSVFQGQELAALREDAVVFGIKQDTLADAHGSLGEELAKLKQDHAVLKEELNTAHELLKQTHQIQETKLEAAGKWIKDLKASELRAKIDQDWTREHTATMEKRLSDLERDNTEKQTLARLENYGRLKDERGREHV